MNIHSISKKFYSEMLHSKIDFSKKIGMLASKSKSNIKTGKCIYCLEKTNKYCNSHSIPYSFLGNIADNGHLYTHSKLIDLPLLKNETGLNESGTFYIICRSCDSKIFSDYEKKDNYKSIPTQKMLAQIALKNFLKSVYQRMYEIDLQKSIEKENCIDFNKDINLKNIDLKENIAGFKKSKKANEKINSNEYYLIFYTNLNYVVPIAFQHKITIAIDLEGIVVNNLYSQTGKMQVLHLCVFPFENTSSIILFMDKTHKNHNAFIKQFNKLNESDKLSLLNYIIFLYSEDYYISPKIDNTIINDEILKLVCGDIGISFARLSDKNIDRINRLKKIYSLSKFRRIPNLLSEKYKLR
ncbi:hypothetical protein I4580_16950 [Proteus mirabilis]|nr:hypothetical protein [Proteus mirabilis]